MNRIKAISSSLRFLNSSLATRVLATRNQVTHFSSSSTSLPVFYTPLYEPSETLPVFYTPHDSLYEPSQIIKFFKFSRGWSEDIEKVLENSRSTLTHETVVYVLKRMDNDPLKVFSFFKWVSTREWFMSSPLLYSLVLRVLASNKMMKEFWITLRTMKEKGFYLDEETYLTISTGFKKEELNSDVSTFSRFYHSMIQQNVMQGVFEKVVGIILGSDWDDEVENELAKVKIQLSNYFVIWVLKEVQSSPLKAYKFFHWVGNRSGYQHNTVTYIAVARILARMESIEEFWSFLDEMESVGHELDYDTYLQISSQLQRNGMMEDAVKLYEHMMDRSYKPLVSAGLILLKSILKSDKLNLDLVFRVAKRIKSGDYDLCKAEYAEYNRIYSSLTSAGRFDEAEKFVETMKNAGYKPDDITYRQIISDLCKMRRFEEAHKVIEEMPGCRLMPNIKAWTVLIQGYCDAGELDNALTSLYKMKPYRDVDADLLEVLVDALLTQKRIDGAYQLLLLEITDDKCNVCPLKATFKKLIQSLLEVRKFEEALVLLRLMIIKNHLPYHEPFVPHISKFGTLEDAAEFLKVLSMKNNPSHKVYLQIFESLFQEGRHSEAKDILHKSPLYIQGHSQIRELFGSLESHTPKSQASKSRASKSRTSKSQTSMNQTAETQIAALDS